MYIHLDGLMKKQLIFTVFSSEIPDGICNNVRNVTVSTMTVVKPARHVWNAIPKAPKIARYVTVIRRPQLLLHPGTLKIT
jgi:hypothetical protein